MLDLSTTSLIRREKAGLLTPLKDLGKGPVYYAMREVIALYDRAPREGQQS